jgi:hypothetical protein
VGQECPDQPYQATLTVNSPNGGKVVQAQADAQGRFKIPLAPGDYILHPESPNGIPSASEQSFRVEAGRFTQVVGITTAEFVNGLHTGCTLLSLVLGAIIPNRFECEEKKCPFILIVVEPVVCSSSGTSSFMTNR